MTMPRRDGEWLTRREIEDLAEAVSAQAEEVYDKAAGWSDLPTPPGIEDMLPAELRLVFAVLALERRVAWAGLLYLASSMPDE